MIDLKFYQKQVCGTLDVNGSVIENPDCTYLNPTAENPQGICMNRWKLNALNFQAPKECTKTFKLDSSRGDGDYEKVLRDNQCDDVTTYYYQHGTPQMCELFFKRASYCLSLRRGTMAEVQIMACSVFQDLDAVKQEVDALAIKMQKGSFQGVIKICAAPHDQAINIGDEGLCPENPDGARPPMNARYCVTIRSDSIQTVFPDCSQLMNCAPFQFGQVAYCDDGKDASGKAVVSKLQCLQAQAGTGTAWGFAWTYIERPAKHQPLSVSQSKTPSAPIFLNQPLDFDRDGRSELTVINPQSGLVRARNPKTLFVDQISVPSLTPRQLAMSGDFNGDGLAEIAVVDSGTGDGLSKIANSDEVRDLTFGTGIPVPGDFDGDGQTDLATFNPQSAEWRISSSRDHSLKKMTFGLKQQKDIPTPADFDGDGITDIAVWRPTNATVYVALAKGGALTFAAGNPSAANLPVFADYDGDRKADLIMFRPATNRWIGKLSKGGFLDTIFGKKGELPLAAAPFLHTSKKR